MKYKKCINCKNKIFKHYKLSFKYKNKQLKLGSFCINCMEDFDKNRFVIKLFLENQKLKWLIQTT